MSDARIDAINRLLGRNGSEAKPVQVAVAEVVAERYALRAANEALAGALQDLVAEQNGPPLLLPRHQRAWEAAMDNAEKALAMHARTPGRSG